MELVLPVSGFSQKQIDLIKWALLIYINNNNKLCGFFPKGFPREKPCVYVYGAYGLFCYEFMLLPYYILLLVIWLDSKFK